MEFIARLCALITTPPSLSPTETEAAWASFEDTVAVTMAGWAEDSTEKARKAFTGNMSELLDDTLTQSPEHAALIHGIAGHALDYDDVHLTSVTHPSVVLVPALMALADARPSLAPRVIDAYAVGLGANIAIGEALGFGHYDRGWHATSTIGPIAGAAALAHLLRLDETASRSALALAAAQSGGFQRNFGTQAKHVQAGQATAAALRAALMAEAGISGSPNIFGENGFFDLFGHPQHPTGLDKIDIAPNTLSVSRKMYPCCYLTHRMISATMIARSALEETLPPDARVVVEVPFGGMRALQVTDPQNGAQAKFCAAYCVAVALAQGHVGLTDFEDLAVHRPSIRRVMTQIDISEDPHTGDMPVGIDHGTVRLRVEQGRKLLTGTEVRHYPGSPDVPVDTETFDAKITDCLTIWQTVTGRSLSMDTFRNDLRSRFDAHVAATTDHPMQSKVR